MYCFGENTIDLIIKLIEEINEKFKSEMKVLGKRIRSLRNSVEEFYETNPEIKEFIYSNIIITSKVDLNDMTLYSISYFEGIYMNKVLEKLYEELIIKNQKSINYGNTIANCLTVKIQSVCTGILESSTILNKIIF